MKLIKIALPIALSILVLTACGQSEATKELESKDTNKAVAKVDSATAASAKDAPKESPKKQDIWTYYNDAKWSDNYQGLKLDIEKVVVSDKAPNKEDGKTFNASAVGVKFKLENTTDGLFTAYPDQARLVTSTGEQIDMPEMFLSDHIGGEIEKGVIKEGNIIWYLNRGHAEDIKWIKLKWSARSGPQNKLDNPTKDFDIELKLK